jgi:phosphoribosylformylglycinamidine cyclo-ligase
MRRTFNLGIGLILLVPPANADAVTKALTAFGEAPIRIGSVVRS